MKFCPRYFHLNFWIFLAIFVVFFVGISAAMTVSIQTNFLLNKKIAENKELKRPAEIDAIVLTEPSCRECFAPATFLDGLKKQNVKIKSEKIVERMSEEGEALVKKFNVEKLPAVILSGELDKDESLKAALAQMGEIRGADFVLRKTAGPYLLVATGEVKGKLKLIMLTDSGCSSCYDVRAHESIVRQFGAAPESELIDYQSAAGRNLLNKYKIKLLPTIVLSGDFDSYPQLKNVWPQVGTIEKDGARVFREGVKGMGVYRDLVSGKIVEPKKQAAAQ